MAANNPPNPDEIPPASKTYVKIHNKNEKYHTVISFLVLSYAICLSLELTWNS